MDNLKIIENVLQILRDITLLLQGWQTKAMIDFEEQKAVADLLRQAISDVWAVSSTDVKREKENSHLIKKLDAHKEQIRKTLSALSEQLNTLEMSPVLTDAPVEQPETKKTAEKTRSVTMQTDKRSIIDKFATAGENSPTLFTPVDNLHNAIGVSDKFLFIRELFNNDNESFQAAVNDLDNMKNQEEAQQYLSNLFQQADKNNDVLEQFTSLVYRRYMNA
ncbi:MAG: hypothetical protein LBB31_04010 [Prevotellaceae bacterium]|jgi:DNA-binding phage protein|nr:hypothetical protein [Prevotellaceae bacterium]